ncbi:L,D-transpeptidase [Mycobacterium antarcticum]|uniref:L,D-transpeptidase n=1 Tax=unclassified Mycolicibacterium TaxID=2636767 RepID=UPI0024E16734|nr:MULTISPECIES: Ig-like domain-containing protein [unclassified Mycolicibacterium]
MTKTERWPLHPERRRRAVLLAAIVVVVAAVASPTVDGGMPGSADRASAPAEPLAVTEPPSLTVSPPAGARNVVPTGAAWVAARSGTLTDVRLVNEQGRTVAGAMTPDATAWRPAEPLGYGRTYTLTATGVGTDATTATRTTQFSTVVPQNQAGVTLTTTSGAQLRDGGTYGVGTVIVARFDSAIADRAAAEGRMKVTTDPPVEGSWSWVNDQKAHWRPREYYAPKTKVRVAAGIYGVELGAGLYGQEDRVVGFTIAPSHVTIADDRTKQVSVYDDGVLVRTMPTSMGRGGSETVGGKTIHFWTQSGVYTVMDKANPVLMDSSTYGLPVNSASGYRISVPYATRISPDGIYLHEREATVWAQGNTNVSAGCLNLSAEDARWFYEFSQPGDVVEIRNTGGSPLEQWQNGDWSVPWQKWLQGSAVRG